MEVIVSAECDGVSMTIYENDHVVIKQGDDLIEMTVDTMNKVNKACIAKLHAYAIENGVDVNL